VSKLRMMDMTSGRLNVPLTFETYEETLDELNQPIKNWEFYCKGWGDFRHLQGDRKWLAAQVQAEGTITVETRYNPGLVNKIREDVEKVRMKADGRTFKILTYNDPDEKRKRLHIDVKEIL